MLYPIHQAQLQQAHQRKRPTPTLPDLHQLLTEPEFKALLPKYRHRLFTPEDTLSLFMAQALDTDHSCQKVVNATAINRATQGMSPCGTATGAYCRARKRLPVNWVSRLTQETGRRISAAIPTAWHWRGRPVRLVDGTTLSLPDTLVNQSSYPQPESQQAGLGFPMCRLVGLLCLGSGAMLNVAMGRIQGKGGDEQSLLRTLLDTLQTGDVLLGDAFFGTYFLLCELQSRQVDAVFEQYGPRRRSTDFGLGQSLGERDHLVVLTKPKARPDWMTESDYIASPDTLTIRELRTGGKLLITTLLCPKKTAKSELKALYRNRWHVELDWRNLKTTLGLEKLKCRSPEMAEKEIWVYMLAYNLIRQVMVGAAKRADTTPRQLSFKHVVQLWSIRHGCGGVRRDNAEDVIFLVLAGQRRVGNRSGRIEPRALKRRPKAYPLLSKPRQIAREEVRLNGHPKKLK